MRYVDNDFIKQVIGQAVVKAVESYPREVLLMDNTILPRLSSNIVKAFEAMENEIVKIAEEKAKSNATV